MRQTIIYPRGSVAAVHIQQNTHSEAEDFLFTPPFTPPLTHKEVIDAWGEALIVINEGRCGACLNPLKVRPVGSNRCPFCQPYQLSPIQRRILKAADEGYNNGDAKLLEEMEFRGDGLADFIRTELIEVTDYETDKHLAVESAWQAIRAAEKELRNVSFALICLSEDVGHEEDHGVTNA